MRIAEKEPNSIEEQLPDVLPSPLSSPLLSREEIWSAIELMVNRIETIDSSCTDIFPLYSPGTSDDWVASPGGSWVGGFWSAWWWLRSRITGSALDQRKASDICRCLSQKMTADSINRSLIFWYGASLGDLWFGDENVRKLVEESIAAIAASYDPEMNCIPLGTGIGGGKNGNRLITVDALAPLIQLLNRSEHRVYHQISRCHADTILAACHTGYGAFHASAYFTDGSFQPIGEAGMWSRGQAWAMLGLIRAAAQWGEPYLSYAQSACAYWKRSRPSCSTSLPPNHLDEPSGLPDASASVIASLAMLSLADLASDGTHWRTYAHQQITAIIRSRYFTGFQKNGKHDENGNKTTSGIFWGCCYITGPEKEELVESAWGSFFLMAALSILSDAIEPGDF